MYFKKKIIVIILAVLFFLLTAAVVLAFVFENRIADIVLNQLYKNTRVEVRHRDISFSLLRKFPLASLQVNNIEADGLSADTGTAQPLLRADMIFLQFSILDIFRNNYTIRKIDIQQATLHLIIDKEGKNNWDIFISDTAKSETVRVELKAVHFRNVDVQFEHQPQKLDVALHFNSLSAKGDFNNHVFSTNLSTNLKIKYIQSDTTQYLANKPLKLRTQLSIDVEKNLYEMQGGNIEIDDIAFNADAVLQQISEDYDLNAKINFENLKVVKILKEMPQNVQRKTARYKPSASLSGNLTVKGRLGKKYKLAVNGHVACKNGSIQNTENDISFSNTAFRGSFSTQFPKPLPQTKIKIESFSTNLNKGRIEGSLSVNNLETPDLDLVLKANIKLEDWQNFFPKNYFHKTSGQAAIDLSFSNHFSKTQHLTASDFAAANIKGNIIFTHAFLQMKEDENPYQNLSGEIKLNDRVLYANHLQGELKGNSFELNGSIENLLPYVLTETERLKIKAEIQLPCLDLDKLLSVKNAEKKKKEAVQQELALPHQMEFNLSFKAKQIKYQNFEAQNASGTAVWEKRTLTIKDLQLSACDGKIHANSTLHPNDNKTFSLRCNAQIQQADMQKAFYAFSNFGQNELTDKNIRGIANCEVQFSAVLENNMKILPQSIVSQIAVNIRNGQLLNFKPMESLSKFVELSELQNIRFETLENQITLENSTIYIPAMDIKNNAINLTISGKQTLDGDIDYRIKMLLKDVLSKKIKEKKRNAEDFGDVVDDNTGKTYLHLIATGNINNPKFKWDIKSSQKGVQQQIATQKQEIETIRQTVNPEKEKQKAEDKELNNSKKKQKEIEIDADW